MEDERHGQEQRGGQGRGTGVLPGEVVGYIEAVVRKVGYRRAVREQVREELVDYFESALSECESEQERQEAGRRLVEEFGEVAVLGRLIRRGKKRCRPLWKKAIVRGLQGTGVLIVGFMLYTAWFVTGRPVVRVDYLAVWNERVRPAAGEATNAWLDYERAIELYVEPAEGSELEALVGKGSKGTRWGKLPDKERALLEEWLGVNEGAWAAVEAGSRKEHCWREYEYGEDNEDGLVSVLLPHLSAVSKLTKLGVWRANRAVAHGETWEKMQKVLTIIRLGRHWQNPETYMVEQLVGQSISRMGHETLLRVLADGTWGRDELEEAQARIAKVYAGGYPQFGPACERLVFADTVQRVFTENGPGGGHLIPEAYCRLVGEEEDSGASILAGAMVHAGREDTVQKWGEFLDIMEQTARLTPYELEVQGGEEDLKLLLGPWWQRYGLIAVMAPCATRVGELVYRGKALHEAVLALKRWEAERGVYPEGLAVLVEGGYLGALPDDPYSAGALRYERRGEDFVLYSVGADFEDDGGVQVEDSYWGEGEGGGDRVFWPVGE